jgi:hypothetical protein
LYAFVLTLLHATCPFHIIFLNLIAMMICGDVHNYEMPHYAVLARLLFLVKIFASQLTSSEILKEVNIKITVTLEVDSCSLAYRY